MTKHDKNDDHSTATASGPGTTPQSGSRVGLGKGLDIGTANIAAALQNDDGSVTVRLERNAFLDIKADVYSKSMLTKLNVPYVVHNGNLVVIGEAAFELANIFSRETRRPMRDGLISPTESDAMPMIKLIIQKVLGEPTAPNENTYFSVPAPSVDADNNIVYHQGLFEGMLRKIGYNGRAINEGHAVVFSDLAEQDFTGIGLSFGGGMVNVCVCYKTIPAISFSVARGGDWIDKNVANVLGVNRSRATAIKESGIDVREPKNREQEAVAIYYRNLIAYTVQHIREKFEQTKNLPSFPGAIDICCAGGGALIGGFIDLFREEWDKIKFPIQVGRIFRAEEALNSVAKGCLVAAAISE